MRSCAHPPGLSRRRWLWGAGLALLGGCAADEDHGGPHLPVAAPLAATPRTAWVFSSGGPRGFVHIGVIKALEELGLRPDLIVGASVGALVGVLYGAGRNAAEIEALALDVQPWNVTGLTWGGTSAFSGAPLARYVRDRARVDLLQDLRIPAVCVAQRLDGGEGVVGFSRGDLGLAVQAACAIEGRFLPVRLNGQRHVDADAYMPLPVRLARSLGATRVLAVDASAHVERAPAGAQGYRQGDLRKQALTRPDASLADVLLHPDFGYWVSLSREFRERSIAAGYRETLAAAPRLRALHAA